MFYRIKDNKIYDFADYKYADDCLSTELCNMREYSENKEMYLVENGELVNIPNPEEIIYQKNKTEFEKEFFQTSLGWIRRKVTMKDGSVKDFLADLLIPIKTGIELENEVRIITYKKPDFYIKPDEEYMKSLQEIKIATPEFIQECLLQTFQDFWNIGG